MVSEAIPFTPTLGSLNGCRWVHFPFITLNTERSKSQDYGLHEKTVLPLIMGPRIDPIPSGFSKVYQVEIHEDHREKARQKDHCQPPEVY